jgi:hypothetical protein
MLSCLETAWKPTTQNQIRATLSKDVAIIRRGDANASTAMLMIVPINSRLVLRKSCAFEPATRCQPASKVLPHLKTTQKGIAKTSLAAVALKSLRKRKFLASKKPRHCSDNCSILMLTCSAPFQRLPTRLTGPPRFIGRPGVTARATGRATSRTPGLTMQPAG